MSTSETQKKASAKYYISIANSEDIETLQEWINTRILELNK